MNVKPITDKDGKVISNVDVCRKLIETEESMKREHEAKGNKNMAYKSLFSDEVIAFARYVTDAPDDQQAQIRFSSNLIEKPMKEG